MTEKHITMNVYYFAIPPELVEKVLCLVCNGGDCDTLLVITNDEHIPLAKLEGGHMQCLDKHNFGPVAEGTINDEPQP